MPEEERSQKKVCVRFNETEYAKLQGFKSSTKAKDLSAFIRDVCLQKPLPMKTQMDSYQEQILSLLIEMRADMLRVGININQSARRINTTTDYHDLHRNVNSLADEMNRIDQHFQQLFLSLSNETDTYGCANQ